MRVGPFVAAGLLSTLATYPHSDSISWSCATSATPTSTDDQSSASSAHVQFVPSGAENDSIADGSTDGQKTRHFEEKGWKSSRCLGDGDEGDSSKPTQMFTSRNVLLGLGTMFAAGWATASARGRS